MSSFAVNDCLDVTRYAGYQRFTVLLGDSSDPDFLVACLKFSALDGCLYATLSFIKVHRFLTGLRSGLFPGNSSTEILLFFSNSVASFDQWQGTPSCMKIVRFQLLFEQFRVFESNHSGVRWNEIQTSSATARHDTPNHMARRVFHCGYNIFLITTLTQWPLNVHAVRYKLLHDAFRKQHFLPLSESPMTMTPDKEGRKCFI